MANSPIILAVDTSDFDTARAWIDATRESIDIYKLGLEFFWERESFGFTNTKVQDAITCIYETCQ